MVWKIINAFICYHCCFQLSVYFFIPFNETTMERLFPMSICSVSLISRGSNYETIPLNSFSATSDNIDEVELQLGYILNSGNFVNPKEIPNVLCEPVFRQTLLHNYSKI